MLAAQQPFLEGKEEDMPLIAARDQGISQLAVPQETSTNTAVRSSSPPRRNPQIETSINHSRDEIINVLHEDLQSPCIANQGHPLYKKIVSVVYDLGAGYVATVGIAYLLEKSLDNSITSSLFFSAMPYVLSRVLNEAYFTLRSKPEVPLHDFVSLYPRIGGSIAALVSSFAVREIPDINSSLITSGVGFFAGKVMENMGEYVFTKGCFAPTLHR